jgi:hypothetical protein
MDAGSCLSDHVSEQASSGMFSRLLRTADMRDHAWRSAQLRSLLVFRSSWPCASCDPSPRSLPLASLAPLSEHGPRPKTALLQLAPVCLSTLCGLNAPCALSAPSEPNLLPPLNSQPGTVSAVDI